MGAGASAEANKEAAAKASNDEIASLLESLSDEQKSFLKAKLGDASEKKEGGEEKKDAADPVLYYMPIAARGMVSMLIAATGGVILKRETVMAAKDIKEDSVKSACGSPGAVPVLAHGDVVLSQSHAIVSYMLNISPKYKTLTAAQHAKDLQVNAIMDDVMTGLAQNVLFNPKTKEDPEFGKKAINEIVDKWFPVIESIMPEKGFVNGLEYPTAADFAILNLVKGQTPFGGCWNMGEVDCSKKGPKMAGVADRTAELADVKKCVDDEAACFAGNPFGLPAK